MTIERPITPEQPKMAKRIGRPKTSTRNDVTVKIDIEAVRLAKIVAAYRGVSLAEYLSNLITPLIQADLEREQSKNPAKKKGTR